MNLSLALQHQQRFRESLDSDKRKNNVIITGMPEDINLTNDDRTPASTDEEKSNLHLMKIGHQITEVATTRRIGQRKEKPQCKAETGDRHPQERGIKTNHSTRCKEAEDCRTRDEGYLYEEGHPPSDQET